MAFPFIPVIIALALYVLHDSDTESSPKVNKDDKPAPNPQTQKKKKVKENKSTDNAPPHIDDTANSVPDSPPPADANSVPTETPPES